jgi:hypothetical protein
MGKEDKVINAEGWEVDPKEIRRIATEMGIPTTTRLPEVIIVDETQEDIFQEGPEIHECASTASPSGYFITIPEKMLEKADRDSYVLGSSIREDIRHELAHYEDYLRGGHVGREKDPYEHAIKELRMELRVRPKSMSLSLALQARGLARDYGLSDEDALNIIASAARELGISSRVVSRMYKLCEE